jgi:transposase
MHRLQELVRLHRLGSGSREMARSLRMGRDTIRAYRRALDRAGLLKGRSSELPDLETLKAALAVYLPSQPPPQQCSSVDSWRNLIADLLERGAGPTSIYDRLRVEHPEFPGSLSAVKRLCLRLKAERGVLPEDVVIPVETEPGEIAQVDFGYAGKRYDPERGVLRKSWVFVLVLGHSRHMVAYLVFDQKVRTWLELHVRAFQDLGGVPKVIVPDNLKAAVIRCAFGVKDDIALNRSYQELARHYGFRIDPTPPRSPHLKGKVESGVKYVKHNFLRTLDSVDLPDDQRALERWLEEIAGRRRHGTTGRAPAEVFEREERSKLLPLPRERYRLALWKPVRLHRDCHVQIDGAFYSAPWRRVGETLWARCEEQRVVLYHDDERIADHPRVPRGQRSTRDEHFPEQRVPLRHRSRRYWTAKALEIGPQTKRLVDAVFDSDDVLHQLRVVQAIVTHLQTHPRRRAEAAARRALHYGCLRYVDVRNILRKGLDLEPLPGDSSRAWSKDSRFARKPSGRGSSSQGELLWQSPMN